MKTISFCSVFFGVAVLCDECIWNENAFVSFVFFWFSVGCAYIVAKCQLKLPIATDYWMNIVNFCSFLQKKTLFWVNNSIWAPTSGLIISQQMNENAKHSWSIFRCKITFVHFVTCIQIISIFEEWTQFDNCFCVTFWCSSIFFPFLKNLF